MILNRDLNFSPPQALLTHQYPESMGAVARTMLGWVATPVQFLLDKAEGLLPNAILQSLTRV